MNQSIYARMNNMLRSRDLQQRSEMNLVESIDFKRRFIGKLNKRGGITTSHLHVNQILMQKWEKKWIWSRFTAAFPPVRVAAALNAWRLFSFWQLAFMFGWTHCTLLSYCTRLVCLRVSVRTCLGGKRDKEEHWATEFHYAESSLWSLLEVHEGHSCEEYQ